MSQLYLFAEVAGARIAVRTEEVEAVVKVSEVAAVPGTPMHIAGLSALRSRVLTMIDIAALIHGRPSEASARTHAIIADIAGHSYGVMVEAVRDICAAPSGETPLRGRLDPAWAPYARAIVDHDSGPTLLVSLARFIDQAPATAEAA